jgi:hypothetical protein
MHYNTFPVVQADVTDFVGKMEASGLKSVALAAGRTLEI